MNLTDEGLRELQLKAIELCPRAKKHGGCMCPECMPILTALKQVRDAAKKEERERCANLAFDEAESEQEANRMAKAIRSINGLSL